MKKLLLTLVLMFVGFCYGNEGDTLVLQSFVESKDYKIGDTVHVYLRTEIPEQYHLYSNPLGPGIGMPLSITFEESDVAWGEIKQEKPEKYIPEGLEDLWTWSWDKSASFHLIGVVESENESNIVSNITFGGLICKSACLPIDQSIQINITKPDNTIKNIASVKNLLQSAIPYSLDGGGIDVVAEPAIEGEIPEWTYTPQESAKELNFTMALILAFVAGLILNFMPCVLPVLGIKILSFSKGRGQSKGKAIANSLAFAAGMILIFLVLATLAVTLGMSWGEQFQSPLFIIVLVSMMFVFALGMFDLFIIFVPSKIAEMDMKQDSSGLWGNFAKGMFATLLATPCSGPFLGATLAWTLTQPTIVVYLVFLSLGLGMAFPYVILAASKRLSSIVPKPGAWMEYFKQILGFFLLGFAVYLMIGLPRDMVLPTIGLQVAIAASVMLFVKVAPFGSTIKRKAMAILFAVLVVGGGYFITFEKMYPMISEENVATLEKKSDVVWEKFAVDKISEAHAEGRPVMIDFTANWCMNCQFNKVNVYHTEEIEGLIKEKNILAIKADLTSNNPVIESLRDHLGSRSIPFLAIFDGDNPETPVVMRDLVSRKKVAAELIKL